MKKIIFTSDLLKVDDRCVDLYANPQEINIDWIEQLFSQNINCIYPDADYRKLFGTENGFESIRWTVFNTLGLQLCTANWALLYEGNYQYEVIREVLLPHFFEVDLVIGFELPPYLLKFLNEQQIKYLDFTIHPIRFLSDYILGVRSNVQDIQYKLLQSKISDELIYQFANISKSRSVRVARNLKLEPDSALFLGQIDIDSSLIFDNRMIGYEDIEEVLVELSLIYSKVYYKAHPHMNNLNGLKDKIAKIRKCSWLDVNIYDAFAKEEFSLIATMSSGSVIEAKYFQKKTKSYLDVKQHFNYDNPNIEQIYYPMSSDILALGFWRWLFEDKIYTLSRYPDPYEGAIKFGLNMKWGR